MNIPIKKWGKDHWGLLAYVETRCVDHKGKLDIKHMRCNEKTHPLHKWQRSGPWHKWQKEWGTKLKNGQMLKNHDDWDCLEDLEREGFLEIISFINGFVKLTEKGIKCSAEIRNHKVNGGQFNSFQWHNEDI